MKNRIVKDINDEMLFISCAKFGNEFYASQFADGMTVQMDIETGKCTLIGCVSQYAPVNTEKKWGATIGYGRYGDYLYLLEDTSGRVAVYSLKNGSVEYIELEKNVYTNFQFETCLVTSYSDKMFIFPCFNDKLNIINMSTKSVENVLRLCPDFSYTYLEDERDTIIGMVPYPLALFSHAIRVDDYVFLFSHILKEVVKFSLITLRVERIPIDGDYRYLVDVGYRKGDFYLLDAWGNVYRWSLGKIKAEMIIPTDHEVDGYYERVLVTDENFWLLPNWGEDIRIVDIHNGKDEIFEDFPANFYYLKTEGFRSKYAYSCEDDEIYYLANYSTNYMLTVNKKLGNACWVYPKKIEDMEKKYYFWGVGLESPCYENEKFCLNEFLSYKSKGNSYGVGALCGIGNNIWKHISE